MSDFLKKIKTSLEKGQTNDEILNHHYDVLKGADLYEKTQKDVVNDDKKYISEISEYVSDSVQKTKIGLDQEDQIEFDEYNKVTGESLQSMMTEEVVDKFQSEKNALLEFEKQQKRKDLIIMNNANIKDLIDENDKLLLKIEKNKLLIDYLKKEIEEVQ